MEENKKIVLDFYAAGGRGDMQACFDLMSEDITWTNMGSTKFSGTYSGKEVLVERLLGPLFSQLKDGISSTVERLTAEGDIVVAQTQGSAETLDGKPYNNRYCQVFRFEKGKIVEVTEYFDTALLDSVFGTA